MFHEFGHALHGLNSNVTYPSLSGTAVARDYVELQLVRARLLGARTGVGHAIALFPNEPLVFGSLVQAGIGARRF
jgi:hypothetical protein